MTDPVSGKKWTKRAIASTPIVDKTSLEAELTAVDLSSKSITSSLSQTTIAGPHWHNTEDFLDGNGSKKPATFLINNIIEFEVSIYISMISLGLEPLVVQGVLNNTLHFSGECANNIGQNIVKIQSIERPTAMTCEKGDIQWSIFQNGMKIFSLPATRVELYLILDRPTPLYSAGVWIEVLRKLFSYNAISGLQDKPAAASAISTFCFSNNKYSYDVNMGAPHFGGSARGDRPFQLSNYLRYLDIESEVNCYDQAAAVQTICGAVGINLKWLFMQPYGQIHETHLIGIPGICNNPFFKSNSTPQNIAPDHPDRTGFGNHAFTRYDSVNNSNSTPRGNFIIDSCAGPHTGTETFDEYKMVSIDTRHMTGGTTAEVLNGITDII